MTKFCTARNAESVKFNSPISFYFLGLSSMRLPQFVDIFHALETHIGQFDIINYASRKLLAITEFIGFKDLIVKYGITGDKI